MDYAALEAKLRREKRRRDRKNRRKYRIILAVFLVILLVLGLGWAFLWRPLNSRPGEASLMAPADTSALGTRLHLVDVGQGLAFLAQSEGLALLIDGGGGAASSKTVAYLKAQGIVKLEYLLITHYDEDHLGGAIGALSALGARRVFGPDYEKDSRSKRSLMRHLEEKGIPLEHPAPGTVLELGRLQIQILGPLAPAALDNNNSLIIRITDGKHAILITGDAEEAEEADMVRRWGRKLASDVLLVGHHGSYTSSTEGFVRKVAPDYLLLSCGAGNEYGHPHPRVMTQLAKVTDQLWRTDKQGDIRFYFTDEGILWEMPASRDWNSGQVP